MRTRSARLLYEPLSVAHAAELHPILATPAVLAAIDLSGRLPTLAELTAEFARRVAGPTADSRERWHNMLVRLAAPPHSAIGRLEATAYDGWGELAYIFGEAWWGLGLASEAMLFWHGHLDSADPAAVTWWAAVHPANERSVRLLLRLGYIEVEPRDAPPLHSYAAGDRCFRRAESRNKHSGR